MTRILIADHHDVVREGLRKFLEAQPDCEVVAEACDGKEAILKAFETKPDIAVLAYSLPLVSGAEVTRQIRSRLRRTEVLIFSMHDNETIVQEVLKAGARGYVLKTEAKQHLLAAIEALASHKPYFTSKISEALLKSFLTKPSPSPSPLTNRERSVVQLIAEGHTNKEIAGLLNISLKTVETHRASIMHKLDLHSPAHLVRYAIRNKLVEGCKGGDGGTAALMGAAPRNLQPPAGPRLSQTSVFQSLFSGEDADFKDAFLSSKVTHASAGFSAQRQGRHPARSADGVAARRLPMPLTRGRGLPHLAQIDGVHFALLDHNRIIRCAVTRGALSHLARKPLAIDQQDPVFSAYRTAIEGIASRKYDAGEKTHGRVIVVPSDLPSPRTASPSAQPPLNPALSRARAFQNS